MYTTIYYSYNFVDSTGIHNELKMLIYDGNKSVQIYPTNVETLTLSQDGVILGTYNGQSDTSIDIPKQDLSAYVTTTSLNNTLNNYVTTTNLNTQLSTKLNINQGSENANKILMVDSNGNISLVDVSVSLTDNTIIFEADL